VWTLITISFSLYLYFKALKLHGTPCIDTTWQYFPYAQTTYEQINTFSLTSQTTALVVFKHQLGMEVLDTTWQYFPYAQTTYEQINTFSLTPQTTALVVFKHQLGMEALDTTKLKQTRSTACDPGQSR